MNKKILLGSILAIVILVLVSFTAVVGYQTTKYSTIAKASPLFSVRSKRAIDEDSKGYTCDYVGKGEESILSIPKRDDRTALQQKFIDMIIKMNDETFNRLVYFLINCHGKSIKEENTPDLINVLHQLKINPDEIKIYITNEKDNELYTEEGFCETVGFIWVPGCLIALILGNLIWLVLSFVTLIWDCL